MGAPSHSHKERLAPGLRIGSYVIEKSLGSGGMGSVWAARHVGLDKPVAIKTLHSTLASNPEQVKRFVREGRAASRIRHENVVDITDFFPTITHLINAEDPAAAARGAAIESEILVPELDEIVANSDFAQNDPNHPSLLAPCDLQALKACGVTFVRSMLERVIEEQVKGDPAAAEAGSGGRRGEA